MIPKVIEVVYKNTSTLDLRKQNLQGVLFKYLTYLRAIKMIKTYDL